MTIEQQMGRELRTIVEIDQDFCQLAYGVAPCTAALGVTGERKCFNALATCQDPENYALGKRVVRFCKPSQPLPDVPAIPIVQSVTTAPTEINPGGGGRNTGPLGKRARVTVTFKDAPHSDIGVDPYVAERNYDPMERGTFWSKWLVRNPYYNSRTIRVLEGYVGQPLAEMISRTYLIDAIEGPDEKGAVKMTARDILALADNDRAQAPAASTGALWQDLDDASAAPITLVSASVADYPAPGTVRINDELIRFSFVAPSGTGVVLSGISRGTDGTTRQRHSAADRVQICLRYTTASAADMAYDWLVNYGSVPAQFIDTDAWAAEAEMWLDQFELTGLITEPTGVNDLLAEITEQCLFYIWWDERAQLIRLAAIKPPEEEPAVFDGESNILADSASVFQEADARISQVWLYWGQSDPTEKLDKESNYRQVYVMADAEAESAAQYGEQRIRKIFSRWLVGEGAAINVSARLLTRYRNNPQYMQLSVDAKDRNHWTGDVVDVYLRTLVDDTGLMSGLRFQIVSAEEKVPGHSTTYKLFAYEYKIGDRYGKWTTDDYPDYVDATDEEKAEGGYWSDDAGKVEGDNGYIWI